MPVLADFRPTQAPGANVQNFLNAYDQTSSMMERKQRLNMAREDQDMQRAEFQAKLPVIQAEGQLRIANAATAITTAAQMATRETEAAQAWGAPDGYNEEFQNILQTIHDPKERSDALESLQGKVAWTKQFKAYAPGVDAVDNARANAFTHAMTNIKLAQALDMNEERVKGAIDRAVIAANAGNQRADTRAGAVRYVADSRLSIEKNRQNKIGSQIADMQDRVAEAEQNAADAQRDGDSRSAEVFRANAASLRDGIQKMTTFSGSAPSAPRTAAQDPRPTTKEVPANPPLTFNGKSLAAEAGAPVTKAVQQAVVKPKVGQRVVQDGIYYKFDGSTWNAEKP